MLPFLATPAEAAYQFYMDSFVVAKDFTSGSLDPSDIFAGANIRFEDEFDAGGPPPDLTGVFNDDKNNNGIGNGIGDFSYVVNVAQNGTAGPEVNYQGSQDLLSLSSDNAVLYTGAGGTQSYRQYQGLVAESGTGLGRTARFAVAGVFQWIVPEDRQRYGIQVQDRTGNVPGDDIISLSVRGTGAGQAILDLRRSVYDDTNGFTIGTQVLQEENDLATPADAAFIALALIHPTADTDQLYAGWMFLDADFEAASDWSLFDAPVDIFHGETTGYRPAFFASQPVPEAESWALMLAGLGLLGWRVRRSRA
jgi:hypothetical protein